MTSKEALEELVSIYNGIQYGVQYDIEDIIELFGTIKQDLERLERLEIENRNNEKVVADGVKLMNRNLELQSRLEVLEKENKPYLELLTNNARYQNDNQILQQENQDLWQQIENYNHKFAEVERKKCDLMQENEKLKKSIALLNLLFNFEVDVETETIYCCLGDVSVNGANLIEDFELLKEVLNN